jgi:hypothetical protein
METTDASFDCTLERSIVAHRDELIAADLVPGADGVGSPTLLFQRNGRLDPMPSVGD